MIDRIKVLLGIYKPNYPLQELLDYTIKKGYFTADRDYAVKVEEIPRNIFNVDKSAKISFLFLSFNRERDYRFFINDYKKLYRLGFSRADAFWYDKNGRILVKKKIEQISKEKRNALGKWLEKQK